MNKGYILLHRKVEDNPVVVKDNDYFRVWIHLLLNSSHSDHDMIFDGETRIPEKGDFENLPQIRKDGREAF